MADTPPIETRTPDQLPPATAVSPDALTTIQEPGGPVQSLPIRALLGRLISTDAAYEEAAAPDGLQGDLDHDENSIGLVFADPDPAKNGWYRKSGAAGAGGWTQFEMLGLYAAPLAQAWAEGTEPGGPGTKSAKEYAETVAETAEVVVYLVKIDDNQLAMVDGSGQRFLTFDGAGRAMLDPSDRLVGLIEKRLSFAPYLVATGDGVFALCDGDGQALLTFDAAGRAMLDPSDRLVRLISDRIGIEDRREPVQYAGIPAPWVLLHFYGQSLSEGLGAAGTISAGTAYPNLFMPNHGVQDATWTDAGGAGLTGYESLSNAIVPLDASVNAHGIEPPVVGAGNQLASRMQCAKILCANAGRGGYGIGGLKKGYNDGGGSGPYALLIDEYSTYADIIGAAPIASILNWMQGEADANSAATTIAGYKADLLGIRANYAADTGQALVHLVTYQFASHSMRSPGYNPAPSLAMGELGEEHDDVSVALPLYFLDHNPLPDGVHLTAASSQLAGAYFGKAQDHLLRTGTKFQALFPSAISRAGKIVTVEFRVPVGNLVIDTDTVSDPGHLGFEVFDGVTGAALAITDVYVFANKAVITLAAVPANPVQVGYALGTGMIDIPAGRFTGPRGCLRDEDDTRAYSDARLPLPNWCLMFRKAEGYGS
jgi:hypothetical protein